MEMSQYSEEIAQQIKDGFEVKGWRFYRSDKHHELGFDEAIRHYLQEDALELDMPYFLLPVADDPRDPIQVLNALDVLADKLYEQKGNKERPTIKVDDESYPLTGITLKEEGVELHNLARTFVRYPEFTQALDSVVDAIQVGQLNL